MRFNYWVPSKDINPEVLFTLGVEFSCHNFHNYIKFGDKVVTDEYEDADEITAREIASSNYGYDFYKLDEDCMSEEELTAVYKDVYNKFKNNIIEFSSKPILGCVSWIKKMIKNYGGYGYTEHCDREGSVFETSPIVVKGNNTSFKYNHHL